jgi:hypothetical protein
LNCLLISRFYMNLNLFLSAVHISFVKLSVLSETFTFRSGHDFS